MTRPHHLALALAAVALLAAGCGSDDGDSSSSGGKPDTADMQEAALKFTRCMRDHGVDMPDPKVTDEGGGVSIQIRRGSPGRTDPAFEKAEKTCRPLLEAARPQMTESEQREAQERALAFVRCLRKEGVDVSDAAAASDGGLRLGPETGFDPEQPGVERAQKACQDKAPGPGPATSKQRR